MEPSKPPTQRTIQVKIGNQAAKSLTPDEAADYLKSIASQGWGGPSQRSSREVHMTFGGGTAAKATTTNTATKPPREPCSEKEMKALMSMFVEIMGLQMNTERLNSTATSSSSSNSKLFSFPANVPPPPGGWPDDLLWPTDATVPPLSNEHSQPKPPPRADLPVLEAIPLPERSSMAQIPVSMVFHAMNNNSGDDNNSVGTNNIGTHF